MNTNIDDAVYFTDRSNIKPSGIGIVRLKLPYLLDMILRDMLYLLELRRNLLSLVLIYQQGHSIHTLDGKVEIRKYFNNKVVMIGGKDEKLLKLHRSFAKKRNFIYLIHQEKGTFSSNLLWHRGFRHLNFDDLCLFKKKDFLGLPTIPKNIEPCEVCILGNHNK